MKRLISTTVLAVFIFVLGGCDSSWFVPQMRGGESPYGAWPITLPIVYCPDSIAPYCGNDHWLLEENGEVIQGGPTGSRVGVWVRHYEVDDPDTGGTGVPIVIQDTLVIALDDGISRYHAEFPNWAGNYCQGDILHKDPYTGTLSDAGDWTGYPYYLGP